MQWNSEEQAYFGKTSDGRTVRVEAAEMAEAAQDAGVSVEGLEFSPDEWAQLVGDNQNVEIV